MFDDPEDTALVKQAFSKWANSVLRENIFPAGIMFITDPIGNVTYSVHLGTPPVGTIMVTPGSHLSDYGKNAAAAAVASGIATEMSEAEHTHERFKRFRSFAVPVFAKPGNLLACIGFLAEGKYCNQQTLALLRAAALSFTDLIGYLREKFRMEQSELRSANYEQELQKRDLLFEVGKRLHAKFDVNAVLSDTLDVFRSLAPGADVEIFLSQDHHSPDGHVKPIIFNHHSRDIRNRAYILAKPIMERNEENKTLEIAVPVSGNQGIYGILQIVMPIERNGAPDLHLFSLLAETAGSAFENARLYEHSTALINELRTINEITRRLNQSLKIKDVFHFATNKLLSIFGAKYACILQVGEKNLIVQASNIPGVVNGKFELGEGYAGVVLKTKEPLIVSDYVAQNKIVSKLMDQTSSRSLIAAPIIINREVAGVILVAHPLPNFFSYDNCKLLLMLSDHIGLAISNASLHAEVRRMAVTDRLTGLFARHYLDEQISSMQKKDICGALILIDIDNFKEINDTFGHQVGDQILTQVSDIIKSSIRETDIAARWGGEEFAIYLPQTTVEHTFQITERIRKRMADETNPGITISCGISHWNWEEEKISVERLFFKADMALYDAKHRGKNTVIVHAN
ncbi:MAG TPA: sensor domain-containing diguanylate cyclase [Bacilli bacterium]